MNTDQLKQLVNTALEDNKAIDITELDVSTLTSSMDVMIVCTATSSRHAKSLAQKVTDASKAAGVRPFGVEGDDQGEWILIDLSDVIVHIMLKDQREFYNLEKLWAATEKARQQAE